jgi:hypothetical protein
MKILTFIYPGFTAHYLTGPTAAWLGRARCRLCTRRRIARMLDSKVENLLREAAAA